MIMTQEQIEKMFTAQWGTGAVLNSFRVCGNRTEYAVHDLIEAGHFVSLDPVWTRGIRGLRFKISDGNGG